MNIYRVLPGTRAERRGLSGIMKRKLAFVAAALALAAPAAVYAQYDVPPVNSPTTSPRLTLEQLPPAAQNTIRHEAAGREIVKIENETWSGHPGYRVEFHESGRNPDVFVGYDGAVLRPEEKPPALGLGTTFEKTPAAVRNAIRNEIGAGQITKIDEEGFRSSRRYRVFVKDPHGDSYELQIARDGSILLDTRKSSPPRGG